MTLHPLIASAIARGEITPAPVVQHRNRKPSKQWLEGICRKTPNWKVRWIVSPK